MHINSPCAMTPQRHCAWTVYVHCITLVCPDPIAYFRHVFQVFAHIGVMFCQHVITLGDEWRGELVNARGAAHGLDTEMIAAHAIQHDHVEGCGRGALLVEAAHVEAWRVCAPVNDLVNGARVAVKGEDDGLMLGEMLYESCLRYAVWMQLLWIQRHQVHDVDDAHFEFGQVMTQPPGGGNRLLRGNIARTGQYHVRLKAIVVAGPVPG